MTTVLIAAQSGTLLYRRLAISGPRKPKSLGASADYQSAIRQITNLRYSFAQPAQSFKDSRTEKRYEDLRRKGEGSAGEAFCGQGVTGVTSVTRGHQSVSVPRGVRGVTGGPSKAIKITIKIKTKTGRESMFGGWEP